MKDLGQIRLESFAKTMDGPQLAELDSQRLVVLATEININTITTLGKERLGTLVSNIETKELESLEGKRLSGMVDGIETTQIKTLDEDRKDAILTTLDANFLSKGQGFKSDTNQGATEITNDFVKKSKDTTIPFKQDQAKMIFKILEG